MAFVRSLQHATTGPSAPTTRWQGMTMARGFCPFARPTARTARRSPTSLAVRAWLTVSPYGICRSRSQTRCWKGVPFVSRGTSSARGLRRSTRPARRGAASDDHSRQGRYPASPASAPVATKCTLSRRGVRAWQVGRQKIPVVRTQAKSRPSKAGSRSLNAVYITSNAGSAPSAALTGQAYMPWTGCLYRKLTQQFDPR